MEREYQVILEHLLTALAAGGLIGFERSYHGRPAGFRTHSLVCVASSALMLLTVYQAHWYPAEFAGRVTLDPTRMAQGIMTGIGFLGAGVIFKEGLTVRGLTTAASIWITAAIGILAGIGFYFPLIVTTTLTLGTLSVFRWIESKVPGEFFAHLHVRCSREGGMSEDRLERFGTYVEALAEMIGHADRAAPLRDYCLGLLLPGERKSVEPIAAVTAPARVSAQHQSLLHFVANAPWSDERVLGRIQELSLPLIEASGAIEAWIIDDTGFPKKGRHSVGVARQYCGQLGKRDNCQVAVSLSLANHAASLPRNIAECW